MIISLFITLPLEYYLRHEYASLKILLVKPSGKNHSQGKEYNSCAILQLHSFLIKTFGQENLVGQKTWLIKEKEYSFILVYSLMSTTLLNGAYQLMKQIGQIH